MSQHRRDPVLPSLDSDFGKSLKSNGVIFRTDVDCDVTDRSVAFSNGSGGTQRDVIVVRSGRKSYGRGKSKNEVLKGIDLTVKEGSM